MALYDKIGKNYDSTRRETLLKIREIIEHAKNILGDYLFIDVEKLPQFKNESLK